MKKIIYIDMDDVLCNYSIAYNKVKKENPKIDYPQSQKGFFENLKPLKNAIKTVDYLKQNFDVYILTAPSEYNPLSYTEKRIWIEKHLGFGMVSKLIITSNKGLNKGNYLIDDYSEGKGQENFEGKLIHFGSEEFFDWDKVKDYFEKSLMILKITHTGDDNSATCLICKTKHYKGKPIIPHPNCACGNLNFDITPYYVRILINWSYVLVKNNENWEVEILKQIKKNKKPTYIKEPSEDEIDDAWLLSLKQVDRKNTVSRSEIMEILDDCKLNHIPNNETKKAINEAHNSSDLTPIEDLDKYLKLEKE